MDNIKQFLSEFKMCGKKRTFNGRTQAAVRAVEIHNGGGPRLRPYHCPHCGGWHLTKKR